MTTPPDFSVGQTLTSAQMNAVGLWKVATASLSGTLTNIANCFTSDYLNYRIMVNFTGITSNTFVYLQFSNGGVVDATANYIYATQSVTATGSTGTMVSTTNTALLLGYSGTANTNAASTIEVYQPQVSGRTYGHTQRWEYDSASFVARHGGYVKDQITSFDGFTIGTAGGTTLSGTVNVYGYR